jgi:general secretion pathway protein K
MRPGRDRGIVLIAVLFTLAIMSVMVAAASALTRASIASERLEQRRIATSLALRSGLESAKALIIATPPEQRAFFDGTPVVVSAGNGIEVEIMIRDAAGLVDLNRSDIAILEALLAGGTASRELRDLATRIAELRAKAAETMPATPPKPPGATAGADVTTPEAPPAPIVFLSVDQVTAMAPAAVADQISGGLTVFNPTGLVNPLAAPDEVLRAIPGLSPADLRVVKQARQARAVPAGQSLQPMLERFKTFMAVNDASVFTVSVRLREGPGLIARSTVDAVVQPVQQGPLPFRTLAVSGL